MRKISDTMREAYGLPEQQKQSEDNSESNEKVREYFENVFKEKKVKPLTNKFVYDSFQEKYFEIYKRNYDIKINGDQLKDIIYYFTGDVKFLKKNRSFDKGLMLLGSYGLGKTSIMKAIKKIDHPKLDFGMKSVNDIVQAYDSGGLDKVKYWIETDNFLFDDLGTEIPGKFYGKETEVMREILEKRHYSKLKTHISTNLNDDEVRSKYGERVHSRMFEMFNVIVFSGSDYRQNL